MTEEFYESGLAPVLAELHPQTCDDHQGAAIPSAPYKILGSGNSVVWKSTFNGVG